MTFTQVTEPSFLTRHKPLFIGGIVASVLIALALGGFITWFIVTAPTTGVPDEYRTVISNLTKIFSGLGDEVASGDKEAVRVELETAAAASINPIERGLLLLIAAQISMLDNPAAGIQSYKTIATDEDLSDSLRSIALAQLVFTYYNASTEAEREMLTNTIFTEEDPFGSMRPIDESVDAREAAYTALLTHADIAAPTPLSSAYIARRWAAVAFHATTTDAAVLAGTRANAEAYIARTKWILEHNTTAENDLNVPTSHIVLGIAETYLAALGNTATTTTQEGPERILQGVHALSQATAGLFAEYEEQGRQFVGTVSPSEINATTHIAWRHILEIAVDLKESRSDIATKLAEAYMTYIASAPGTSERMLAEDQTSDTGMLVKVLRDAEILPVEVVDAE